ncbi:hypothetical protein CR513_06243, partial [Mucuna pruriens]
SKSEGRSNNKFWSTISFSPTKDKKPQKPKKLAGKPTNGVAQRRVPVPPSPHELHYKANRAQAEELRKKTFLPYRQGLLGCLGFSSKGYGALIVGLYDRMFAVSDCIFHSTLWMKLELNPA